jgi:arylsulfatase A-like enzyme
MGNTVKAPYARNEDSSVAEWLDTFPKILRERGYHSEAIGKMHYTPSYLDVGFDRLLLSEQDGQGRYDDDYHKYLMKPNQIDFIDLLDQEKEYYSTTWIGERAIEALDS